MPQNNRADRADENFGRIVSVMRSPQFKSVVRKLDGDPGERAQARANPKAYLRGQGVPLDDEMEVTIKEGTWSICVNFGFVSACYAFD